MQCGITLAFGKHKGRLIMPARITGPKNSNAVEWRPYHYSTALYSDDGGAIWQTSKPFPVLGTGEAALAELSDGSILYNSREHMSRGNRFLAYSHDGGELWIGAYRSPDLPDGVRGTSYGCMGGMIRLPVAGHDILLYSNLDTDAGEMPAQVGASTARAARKSPSGPASTAAAPGRSNAWSTTAPAPTPISAWAAPGRRAREKSTCSSKADRTDAMKPSR